MCAGLPTVGTKIAFEGMAIEIKDCIAKNENDMSEKIVKLYQDRDLWNQCASEASEIARKEYSVGTLRQNITKILLEIERL
jgi:glycosyltransferase involved in cell wall biosynthesis